jgi:hypothetical protein
MVGNSLSAAPQGKTRSDVSIFGPVPVLKGEDAEAYYALLAEVSSGVKPSDIIEEMWVQDVVYLSWEIFRWRRVKASIVAGGLPDSLKAILAPIAEADGDSEWMNSLIKMWCKQKPSAIKRVNKLLASANLTFDAVIARAIWKRFEQIERIDHWITIAEGRRNVVLREIDRHRTVFAQTLRDTMQKVEEAQHEMIESKAIVSDRTVDTAA